MVIQLWATEPFGHLNLYRRVMAEEARSAEPRVDLDSQLSLVLSEVRKQRQEVSALREEVQCNSFTVNSEVKKLRSNTVLSWRYQGNKLQYEFNTDLDEGLKQATWALEHNKVDYCAELLKEALEKLRKRNKLIRIADTSSGGWDTVKHYEANPIASDSDDEAKIYKAENRALKRKRSTSQGKRSRTTASSFSNVAASTVPSATTPVQVPPAPFVVSTPKPFGQHPFPVTQSFRGIPGTPSGPYPSGNGIGRGACFSCGDFRHFRKDCPNTNRQAAGGHVVDRKSFSH